ncbi:unnamed protein product [Didymodactylos carnosus]|uniref:Rab9 effector protein with kelch motifs n=1 Tax=Didymodactylos carnosus TaxID=1234261 RepID=A0A8S2GUS8_9BILA|nr:unnamed protein product [Didymodactylos carnosus]CAF3561095.1 unnamed protein product [Didymodactylos carnosus]
MSSYKFDNIPDRLEWSKLDCVGQIPIVRVGHSACFVLNAILTSVRDDHYERGCIYILGGANPSQCFADIHMLTLSSLKWTKIIDNEETLRKYEHSTVYYPLKNSIIYFGGANTEKNFNDVNQFNIAQKAFQILTVGSNIVSPRTHHTSVIINDSFYIFSGGDKQSKAVCDSELYRFDIETRTWETVQVHGIPPEQRHGHCMLAVNRTLYLHGGMDNRTFFKTLYSIDLEQQTLHWTEYKTESNWPMARAAHGGVAWDERLYIFGGLGQGGQALNDLWSWDCTTKQWTELCCRNQSIISPRLDFACCLIQIDKSRLEQQSHENYDETSSSNDCQKSVHKNLVALMFIHGGTDTEGEVFDDCFILRIDEK